jgi:hypothetical protein
VFQDSSGSALFLQLGLTVLAGVAARLVVSGLFSGASLAERVRQALNKLVLWITMPVLVFQTVHAAPLGADLVQAPLAAIAGMAGTALVAWLFLVRLYGKTPETGGLVLAASAGSVSFFGIPLARALFGPNEARVAVYFAVLNVPLALLSAAIISGRIRGGGSTGGLRGVGRLAIRQLINTPTTWALIAALALQELRLPLEVEHTLKSISGTVAPTTMFALGLGLRFDRSFAPYRMALPAVAIKLAISPIVVFACAWAIGLSGLPLAIVSLQGAMPTQVLSVVVAERYRLDSRLVGLVLALDTALSFLVMPFVVRAIRAGMLV